MIRVVAVVAAGFAAGPALSGETVLWGEEARNGATRVVMAVPDGEPLLIHRVPPATAPRTTRGFGPPELSASAVRFGAIIATGTVIQQDFDSVGTAVEFTPISGRLKGPVESLSDPLPARGDLPCRRGEPTSHVSVLDVDGDRVATGQDVGPCRIEGPRELTVTVREGAATRTVRIGSDSSLDELRLSGRYVAWLTSEDQAVVHDLERGVDVVRVTARDLRTRFIHDLALQEDGTVALAYGNLREASVAWISPVAPGVRVLDRRRRMGGVALAGGRILYQRGLGRGFLSELVVRSLSGGPARRLARFSRYGQRVGQLDLDASRASWARHKLDADTLEAGPTRIFTADL